MRLRVGEFDRLANKCGLTTINQRCEALGISPAQLAKVRSGQSRPGAKFIDRCLSLFGPASYHDLFERVTDREERVA